MPEGAPPTSIVPTTFFFAGSIFDTAPAAAFATQTESAPTATAFGSSPTGIVTTDLESVSIRVTVSSQVDAIQTAPLLAAIPAGSRPTLTGICTGPCSNVSGSNRWTVASPLLDTQIAPSCTITPAGPAPPTSAEPSLRPLEGASLASVESPKTAQTDPAPAAMPALG